MYLNREQQAHIELQTKYLLQLEKGNYSFYT